MRTKKNIRAILLAGTFLTIGQAFGQASVPGNSGGPGDYVGWDAGTPLPLDIKHEGNFPIDFSTTNLYPARINHKVQYPIGSAPSAPRDGFMLLSGRPDFWKTDRGPFTRLHLVDDVGANNPTTYAQPIGYRRWMRNGITFTGNSDQAYIGQKYAGDDNTDFVIQWSDNPNGSPWGVDRMKFIFSSEFTGAHSGMGSEYGLEAMRFWPRSSKDVNVGVGDFFAAGNIDPTERLHILDGRVRIQQLPDDQEADQLTKFMVVDDAAGGEHGVVKWRYLPTVPPPNACASGWSLQGNNAVTAFNGNPCPPQDADAVGIGTNFAGGAPTAKLNVFATTFNTGMLMDVTQTGNAFGAIIHATGGGINGSVRGVQAITYGTSHVARAGDFISYDVSPYATGVFGQAFSGTFFTAGVNGICYSDSTMNFGVVGESRSNGRSNVGVYASQGTGIFAGPGTGNYGLYATTHTHTSTDWAGWFQGDVMINGNGFLTGMLPITSDASLKTNVQDITDASELLGQLLPKTYDFLVDEHPEIALPLGPQIGFIAQDVELVLPQLVKQVTIPSTYDSTGAQVTASEDIKTLNYIGIIPLLVAGYQQQQATIALLQDQINNCCAAQGGMAPQGGTEHGMESQENDLQEQRLLIIPNPVADLTTLEYYVPKAGKVSLQVSTSDGKPLATLREELAEAGAYNYSWNTTKLSAGTYFCTFMLDGAVVVKRAVKVK